MKLVFEQFFCPACKQLKWLRIENICVDCEDKRKLQKISQIRKSNCLFDNLIDIAY